MRLDPNLNRVSKAAPTAPLTASPGTAAAAPATAPLPKLGTDALSLSAKGGSTATASLSDLVAKAKEASAKQGEWTMAVNLAASIGDEFGAVYKAQQLKELAKETEGKPVTIVAQQISQGPDGPMVERFVIKDGKVTSQGQTPSKGFAQDLEDLTAMAATDHPSKRMGVMIQSHGNAISGMSGDNGRATLDMLAEAMRDGLALAGRGKLDLLNFDACLMGQQEVLNAVQGLSDHVVASSEVELANGATLGEKADGQPMAQMLRALIADPEMDGAALAKKTVELASQAARPLDVNKDGKADPGVAPLNATPTLSYFDMAHLETMNQAVDTLGAALTQAMQDPKSRTAIAKLITSTPRFSASSEEGAAPGMQQRDLKRFSEGLDAAIAQGRIQDPTGALSKASKALQEALDDLVGAHHGEEAGVIGKGSPQNYRDMGGIGIFLPSAEFLQGTPETLGTALDQIVLNAGHFAKLAADPEMGADELQKRKGLFMRGAGGALAEIAGRLPESRRGDFAPLRDAYLALEKAETPAEIAKAAERFGAVADKLKDSPLGRFLTEQKAEERQALISKAYSLAEPHMTEGWKQFTQALRDGA